MQTDKKRRGQLRTFRKMLGLKQSELAVMAGVSRETVARYERCKRVSPDIDARIFGAILKMVAKKNPEPVKQAAQKLLEEAENWEKILSVEPGSQLALDLERLNQKSLGELRIQAETMGGFLRRGANIPLSLLK